MQKQFSKLLRHFPFAASLIVSVLLPLSLVFSKPALAWSFNMDYNEYDEVYGKATEEGSSLNLVPWSNEVTLAIVKQFEQALAGDTEQTTDESGGPTGYRLKSPGLVQLGANAVNFVYDNPPPFSGGAYLASLNPLKAEQAYAAGADVLGITREIWQAFRDIAYFLSIVILIFIGAMIMFRVRFGRPGLEVTLMAAVPKIVVTLILITFSYAISGFLVDIYYLTEEFLKSVFSMPGVPGAVMQNVGGGTTAIPYDFTVLDIFAKFGANEMGGLITDPTSGIDFGLGGLGNALVGSLFVMAIALTFFSVMMGLFFKLIKYYATWFLLTIFSPIAFLWSAVPGQEDTAIKWLKSMLVCSLVFSVTYFLLNMAGYFKGLVDTAIGAGVAVPGLDVPTVLDFSAAGGAVPEFFSRLIYFALILAVANVPEAIEDALQATGFGGKGRPVDLAAGLKKVPIVGGLMG